MKIQLNKNLVGLDGKEIENSHMGKLVASTLAGANKGDAAKFWHWSTKFYAGEEVELDPSDSETLRNFIKDSEQLTILSKAQILAEIK
jgi:hypothetical protein